jgi:hypothetical protein
MTKHNKKRNVGLVYEMLINYVSDSIINDRQGDAKKAIKIIERRFDKNTHLFKEFRLFKALADISVSDTSIAAGILHEAKSASRRCDMKKLEREKSLLIKDINYQLSDKNFFHRRIEEYKTFATIQTLLNEWRKEDSADLSKVAAFESLVIEHLLDDKKSSLTEIKSNQAEDMLKSDLLIFNILSEKMNKKYNNTLTNEQKDIVRNYAIYSNEPEALEHFLNSVKSKILKQISEFKSRTTNKVLLEKIDNVYNNIKNLEVSNIDDDAIKKYLTISNLKYELLGSTNE